MSDNRDDILESLGLQEKKSPSASPAIGLILVILILIGSGILNGKSFFGDSSEPAFVAPQCKISGCNLELCVGANAEVVSDCSWQPKFSCYSSGGAKCEVQTSGECGWTQDNSLKECLANAS